jgi:hypothetical protein
MEWIQFSIFFVGVVGLWFWNRTESRADNRHMDNQLKNYRDLILEVHKETAALIMGMRDEMKDFHYRLLEIERSRK